jgi:hypothetical protein
MSPRIQVLPHGVIAEVLIRANGFCEKWFDLGNTTKDVKIHTKSEIDILIDLLKTNLQKI